MPADRGLADLKTEIEQFALNAACVTEQPGEARSMNWSHGFHRLSWAIGDSMTAFAGTSESLGEAVRGPWSV